MRRRTRYQPDPEDRYAGLPEDELNQLGTYNAERGRGIMHTPEWQAKMAALQARFDAAEHERVDRWRQRHGSPAPGGS